METREIKAQPADTLTKIEFINTGDGDFKAEIKTWIQANHPDMSFEDFFDKLEVFQGNMCRINMTV